MAVKLSVIEKTVECGGRTAGIVRDLYSFYNRYNAPINTTGLPADIKAVVDGVETIAAALCAAIKVRIDNGTLPENS